MNPITHPNKIAPSVSYKNNYPMNKAGGIFPFTNSKLMVNRIIQDPSLSKLSPSIKELNFRGAPASFRRASTATVSVQDNTDPNMNA
jgi:hypothetical protein